MSSEQRKSFGVVMEAELPLSDKQSSASLPSDQGLSVVVFSNDHPSTHGSDVKLDMTQSDKKPPRQKSASSLHGITITPYKLVLIAGIIFIIALFSLPIILYYSLNDSPPDSSQRFINISQGELYVECRLAVEESNCTRDLTVLYNALGLIGQFEESFCISMTQHLFCQALNNCHNQSYVDELVCQDVRQEYCTAEWRIVELLGGAGLTDCAAYGETERLTCSDQFGVDDTGLACQPLCKEFSQYGESTTTAITLLTGIASTVNAIGGIVVLIVAFYRREKIFHFPSVLIVINAGVMTFLSLLLAIPSITFGGWRPLCTDKFLNKVIMEDNVFCQVDGFIATSTVVLYCAYWCLYIFHVLLKIVFPVWSRFLYTSARSTKIHTIEVASIFVAGTLPYIVVAATSNYVIAAYPPIGCHGDAAHRFYTLIVPTVMLSCCSLIMMLIILYNIHIQQGLLKRRLCKSKGKLVWTCHFSTPEVKMFVMLCFLLVIMITVWISFSVRDGSANSLQFYLEQYWRCMAGGTNRSHTCEKFRNEFEKLSYPGLECIYLILFTFLNFSSLPFVIQYKEVKQSVKEATRRLNLKKNTDSNSNSKI